MKPRSGMEIEICAFSGIPSLQWREIGGLFGVSL